MQQLEDRNTYTPTDAPQVCCDCDSLLNKEETLSVDSLKTSSNDSDVDLPWHREQSLRVFVYVLNMRGQPLMPTNPTKAKHLVDQGKAIIIKRVPFTIQLLYPTGEAKQPIKLGIDAGYKKIGFSATTDKHELISGEVALRMDIPDKIRERAMYRRNRRSRHHWYRPSRFMNRGIPKGWLSPSIEHKLNTHVRVIDNIRIILPITSVTIEVASFDTQKMQNPEISGIEYQQGTLQGYEIREYLLEKFHRTCIYCGKTDVPMEIEHVIPESRGGSSRVSNLVIACHECNKKKDNQSASEFGHPEVEEMCKQPLKSAAFMNIVRWKLINILRDKYKELNINYTYGYITKCNRIQLGFEKSNINDAFVISGGTNQIRCRPYSVTQNRRNNRSLQLNRNGYKPSIRKKRYKYQPRDIVKYNKLVCIVKGVFNKGTYVRIVGKYKNVINTNIKNVELIKYGKGLQYSIV